MLLLLSRSMFPKQSRDRSSQSRSLEEKPGEPKSEWGTYATYFYGRNIIPMIKEYIAEGGSPDAPGNFPSWLYRKMPYTHLRATVHAQISEPWKTTRRPAGNMKVKATTDRLRCTVVVLLCGVSNDNPRELRSRDVLNSSSNNPRRTVHSYHTLHLLSLNEHSSNLYVKLMRQ